MCSNCRKNKLPKIYTIGISCLWLELRCKEGGTVTTWRLTGYEFGLVMRLSTTLLAIGHREAKATVKSVALKLLFYLQIYNQIDKVLIPTSIYPLFYFFRMSFIALNSSLRGKRAENLQANSYPWAVIGIWANTLKVQHKTTKFDENCEATQEFPFPRFTNWS